VVVPVKLRASQAGRYTRIQDGEVVMCKRTLVLFSVVFLAMACNPSGGTSNAYDMEVGLLALDFSPMAEPLRSSDQLPTHANPGRLRHLRDGEQY